MKTKLIEQYNKAIARLQSIQTDRGDDLLFTHEKYIERVGQLDKWLLGELKKQGYYKK